MSNREQETSSSDPIQTEENYALFRECFSSALLERLARPEKRKATTTGKRRGRKGSNVASGQADAEDASQRKPNEDGLKDGDQEELAEFIEFLASEIFPILPSPLQTISSSSTSTTNDDTSTIASLTPWTSSELTQADVDDTFLPLLPGSVTDSVTAYALLPASTSLSALLHDALTGYADAQLVARQPVAWSSTRADACEICGRDWLPLTYHHLIPRSVHAKAIKRGWHPERMLNAVAWLCRACHSFVHRAEPNEELAKNYYTVEKLLERDDVARWAAWVGRVRWKAR